jgi:hypothetical protein
MLTSRRRTPWPDAASALRPAGIAHRGRIGAHEVRRPVGLPGAVVIRKGLLPAGVVAVQLVPDETDLDGSAVVGVLAVKLAALAIEAADHRCAHHAGGAAYPVDRPLMLFHVESAHRQARPPLGREMELVDGGRAFEILGHAQRGRERLPLVAARPALFQTTLVSRPGAREVMEIIHVAGARGVVARRQRRVRGAGRHRYREASARGNEERGEAP